MENKLRALTEKLGSLKYVLLAAAVGAALLLWPVSAAPASAEEGGELGEETRIAAILSAMEGVGPARVLLSEQGAVVVCPGAEDPSVCLRIVQAVRCYTGLYADDVRVFQTESGG